MKKIIVAIFLLSFIILTGCKMTYRVTFYEYDNQSTTQDISENECASFYTPTLDGYTFLGWFTEDDTEFDFSTPITKNINLYASYKKNDYQVTFMIDEEDSAKNIIQKVERNDRVIKPVDPVKEDYIFMGWLLGDQYYDFTTQVTSDLTIKAYFEKDSEYTPLLKISFNSIGGGEFETISIRRLDNIESLPVAQKDNYEFLGWYYNDTLITTPYQVKEITDFTLVARYKEIE